MSCSELNLATPEWCGEVVDVSLRNVAPTDKERYMRQLGPPNVRCLLAAAAVAAVLSGDAAAAHAQREGSGKSIGQHVTRASWYGRAFHGRRTASGRIFNQNELTAAHRTLRLGTRVRVTELRGGRSVVVRITDRGPYVRGRGIDLSYAAARHIGIIERGVAPVRLEPIEADQETPPDELAATASKAVPELRALASLFE